MPNRWCQAAHQQQVTGVTHGSWQLTDSSYWFTEGGWQCFFEWAQITGLLLGGEAGGGAGIIHRFMFHDERIASYRGADTISTSLQIILSMWLLSHNNTS